MGELEQGHLQYVPGGLLHLLGVIQREDGVGREHVLAQRQVHGQLGLARGGEEHLGDAADEEAPVGLQDGVLLADQLVCEQRVLAARGKYVARRTR